MKDINYVYTDCISQKSAVFFIGIIQFVHNFKN